MGLATVHELGQTQGVEPQGDLDFDGALSALQALVRLRIQVFVNIDEKVVAIFHGVLGLALTRPDDDVSFILGYDVPSVGPVEVGCFNLNPATFVKASETTGGLVIEHVGFTYLVRDFSEETA